MKAAIRCLLCAAVILLSFSAQPDEILYWMLDNPTIYDYVGQSYKLSDRTTTYSGREMPFARIAAIDQTKVDVYNSSRLSDGVTEGDLVFLDLYYKSGSQWILDKGYDTAIITSGGKVDPYQRSSIAASLSASIPGVDWTTYSFAVELGMYNDNGDWIVAAISGSESYDRLVAYRSQQIDIPYATPWKPDVFFAPEPSSGILILFGFALMGLKRKTNMEV